MYQEHAKDYKKTTPQNFRDEKFAECVGMSIVLSLAAPIPWCKHR